MPRGRPSIYTPELAATIIARLAGGLSLERLCRGKGMPSASTVFRWLAERPDFREAYVRAGEAKGIRSGERVVDIAERCLRGEIPADVARAAIDGHKWAAGRLAQKVYGDRLQHTGQGGGPIQVTDPARFAEALRAMSPEELALLDKALTKAITHEG